MLRARRRRLVRFDQFVTTILPHGFEQPVADFAVGAIDDDKRLVDQACQQIEHLETLDPLARAHALRRLQRPPAAEDREPPQHGGFLSRQQIL